MYIIIAFSPQPEVDQIGELPNNLTVYGPFSTEKAAMTGVEELQANFPDIKCHVTPIKPLYNYHK